MSDVVFPPRPGQQQPLGAHYLNDATCSFRVWAPGARRVDLHLVAPSERLVPLAREDHGYFSARVTGVEPGARYLYKLDESDGLPDPASRFQPEGVHGPSAVVSDVFAWTDSEWRGLPLREYVIYELHVGTFTTAGTFDGVIAHLSDLRDLGLTAIEVMPVAQFPGTRNWGYDGVNLFAVQASYGGPDGLRRLVDAAHALGLAVILDVVYNHLGPEGNYLGRFGPYFTNRYQTPWGEAVNYDGADSHGVRDLVLQNAVRWTRDFHVDGLRLDAVHSIFDESPRHILTEIVEGVHDAGGERLVHVIAESDLNDVRLIRPVDEEGYGLDAQWSDDFHHALHALLTAEREGYYGDYGTLRDLAKAYAEGFVYTGQYSRHRGRPHGTPSGDLPLTRFVVCTQNHDQTGNRMLGDRLAHLVVREELLLSAGALLLAPYIPLLFMGQEYAEPAPFLYFVSHSDPGLIEAVREGRRREFAAFSWQGDVPDPQDEATFLRSRLDHSRKDEPAHRTVLEFYRELLRLRRTVPALQSSARDNYEVVCLEAEETIVLRRWHEGREALVILHFGAADCALELPARAGTWRCALDSAGARWLGPGNGEHPEVRASGGHLAVSVRPKSVSLWLHEPGATTPS